MPAMTMSSSVARLGARPIVPMALTTARVMFEPAAVPVVSTIDKMGSRVARPMPSETLARIRHDSRVICFPSEVALKIRR